MKLTILQQNDTHGCLEPHPEFFWHAGRPIYRTAGGYARISGYVQQVREDTDHVLYVDGGDVFHGTGPLVKSQGEIMIDILNHLRLDAMVPGNWDFAYGPDQLRKLAGSLQFPLLACNVHGKKTPFAAYAIKEYPGCRVGLIGLAYPHLEETMPPSFAGNFNFTHGVEELSKWIPRLRSEEKADLIIVLSHMGLPLDVKLAGLVSGIDILLSGHSHDRIKRPIRTNGTLIVKSGASGSFIGRLDIELEFGRIARFQHRLVTLLEADYPLDPNMQTLIDAHLSPYRSEMMEVVAPIGDAASSYDAQ
ncbi:bifunctional metallophosphatase/5'-nucleotidase [Paenibacillus thermotolerans]|uniref:bifunctional metallophosphatase/5'-nucleotidase n=1 Tax=Paenibacillus thermotolerans TaxID=3027807 RepID=UPI002367E70F|nr:MULTISPECIES: metallophosphoesterase [unclassified Paenibacillus]